MGPAAVDLNADLGEGFGPWRMGDDAALLDVVTSANVACGFHAGGPSIMRATCDAAVERGVAIGAHVYYRVLDVPVDELRDQVAYQLGALDAVARAAGGRVAYCKPHGALYNRIAVDAAQAGAVVQAVAAFAPGLPVLGLPGSVFLELAEQAGLAPRGEAFADRGYTAEGRLVPRAQPGAVLHDPGEVVARSVAMARDRKVTSVDGAEVGVDAVSLCVHGDTPGAVDLARAVRAALEDAGLVVAPFADR
jgi:5-oxoprolinase (ATP-hydrolysing) subunit A